MVHGLEAEYVNRIKFAYLDADDPRTFELQQALGFRYQPELYLLDGSGNVVMKWVGYVTEADLELAFAQNLP